MAFSLIKPAVPMAGAGKIRIRTVDSKAGWKILLSIPTVLMAKAKWFDPPSHLVVMIGDGPDAGKLQLVAETEETKGQGIKVAMMRRTCMLRLPVQEWMPQLAFDPEAIDEVAYSEGRMVLALPEWAWNKDRQRAIGIARRQDQADAAKRLTAKGPVK